MSSEQKQAAGLAKSLKDYAELDGYFDRFEAAFDELHGAVVRQAKEPGQYIAPHSDYPVMSLLDGGFPAFREVGFFQDSAPRHYVSMFRPRGLLGALFGYQRPENGFPRGAELAEYLRTHDVGKRLNLEKSDLSVDLLVGDAVERYLHMYGLDAPIDSWRRHRVLLPLFLGTLKPQLELRLVIPIAMTHFDIDHFPLSETSYIARMPKRLQLARARMSTLGTGAAQMVVGAATHAFVSNGWHLDVDQIDQVSASLSQSSPNVSDAVDSFFGALRVSTGISSGYAQMLWVPKKWALRYFCDLTPVYGRAVRQCPSWYDDFGWTRQGENVTKGQLADVRRVYNSIISNKSEAVRLALRRLNSCLTRDDPADAILDGTIGLELLLGDDQNQSLSYKLRLRAGALALLQTDPTRTASDVASKVKRVYSARSEIVHGRRKKSSKKASEPADMSHSEERKIAADLLRFALDVLLTRPEYQDPTKIDDDLLLRRADVGPSRRPKKAARSRDSKE